MTEASQPLLMLPKHTRSCDNSQVGWPLTAPKHFPHDCVGVARHVGAQNGCLFDLFGQHLSWQAHSKSRLRRQIGRCHRSSY